MPITNCLDCKKEVSTSAVKCPHCGAVTREGSKASNFAFIVTGMVILFFVIQFLSMK
jgi:hypothetical protein